MAFNNCIFKLACVNSDCCVCMTFVVINFIVCIQYSCIILYVNIDCKKYYSHLIISIYMWFIVEILELHCSYFVTLLLRQINYHKQPKCHVPL